MGSRRLSIRAGCGPTHYGRYPGFKPGLRRYRRPQIIRGKVQPSCSVFIASMRRPGAHCRPLDPASLSLLPRSYGNRTNI
jgi:hypothetical protein